MTRRHLLSSLRAPEVEAAIRQAEQSCAVELRVSIAGLFWGSPENFARSAFERLGMTATSRRNGLLVFIAPWHRKVVIHADQGITSRVNAALWSDAVATITAAFRSGRFTEGLVEALQKLAAALAPHFPPVAGTANELPDTINRS
ncbi:MAG TPA: TPM domain-containing protein [Polyangia bacterium]|nr:TPM domain-containing protein [Polyangia bacterium]